MKLLNNCTTTKQQSNTKKKEEKKLLFCNPCYTRQDNICIQQEEKRSIFKSYKTGKTHKIFHELTYKSQAIIYLLQCSICFIQYVGKSEIAFNLQLNNHRKDSKNKLCNLSLNKFSKPETYI